MQLAAVNPAILIARYMIKLLGTLSVLMGASRSCMEVSRLLQSNQQFTGDWDLLTRPPLKVPYNEIFH